MADGPDGLRAAVVDLADRAEERSPAGAGDRRSSTDGDPTPDRAADPEPAGPGRRAPPPRSTATCARSPASSCVTDDARDVHDVAALLGYGADAVCPRLALQTVAAEADADESDDAVSAEAQDRFRAAVETGVLKVLSKMGISTVDSYRGAQIFEALGLADEVVDLCFTGTPSVVGGLGWAALGEDVLRRHAEAFPPDPDAARPRRDLDSPGYYRVRKGGEYHANGKEVVQALNDLTLVQETPPAVADPLADAAGPRDGRRPPAAAGHRRRVLRRLRARSPRLVDDRPADRAARPARAGRRAPSRSPSTRSSRRARSPGASRPGPCPTARCRRRPTRTSPRP